MWVRSLDQALHSQLPRTPLLDCWRPFKLCPIPASLCKLHPSTLAPLFRSHLPLEQPFPPASLSRATRSTNSCSRPFLAPSGHRHWQVQQANSQGGSGRCDSLPAQHLRGLRDACVQRRGDTGGAIADLAPGPAPAPRAADGPAWAPRWNLCCGQKQAGAAGAGRVAMLATC
jgi:hypothetical protein